MSPEDLYKQSDMVFYGQVISKQAGPGPDYDYYQIKVQTYFKNPQTSDSITVAGHKPEEGHVTYPQFEIGDKAVFYINKLDGVNTISPYSQIAGDACDIHSFLGPAPLPGEKPIIMPASGLRLVDADGNAIVGSVSTNHEVVIRYDDIWNNYPESRVIPVETSIVDSNAQTVFYKKQNFDVQACDGPRTITSSFAPTQSGNYIATIVVDNKTTLSSSFDVKNDSSSHLNVTQASTEFLYSGSNVTERIEYHITAEPKLTGELTVDVFKNNHLLRKDTLSDRDIVTLSSGAIYYFYQPVLNGTRDVDVYRLEFNYSGQNVEKIVPISSPSSLGIVGKPDIQSPLKQFKSGIAARDVTCKEGLQLVIRAENTSPACVLPQSVQKLIQLGWAMQGEKNYHIYFPGRPPPVVDTRIAKIVSGTQEAQSVVGYRVDIPHYLPHGYSTQVILVDNSTKFVKILASNFPITQNTTSVEFMDNGGILIYMEPLTPAFNQTSWSAGWLNQTSGSSIIKIAGYGGVINDIMKEKRFDEELDIPAELVIFRNDAMVEISGFVNSGELIKIAESMLKS